MRPKKTIEDYRNQSKSYSFLKQFTKSPAHAKAYMEQQMWPTKAMIFGRLFHSVMAGELDKDFIVWGDGDKPRTDKSMAAKENRLWHSDMVAACLDTAKNLAYIEDVILAEQMKEGIMKTKVGRKMVDVGGEVEKKVDNGRLVGICDKIIKSKKRVVDWKSIAEIKLDWLEQDMKRYHLDLQAAIYNELTGFDMLFGFIEKKEPFSFLPVLVEADSDMMLSGRAKLDLYYKQAIECFDSGKWPGIADSYPDGFFAVE